MTSHGNAIPVPVSKHGSPQPVEPARSDLVLQDHGERRQPASRVRFLPGPDQVHPLSGAAGRSGLPDQGVQGAGSE